MSIPMNLRLIGVLATLVAITTTSQLLIAQETNDVERQLQSQIELLKAAKSDSPCVNAVWIALTDPAVRQKFIGKAQEPCFVLKDVCCLDVISIPGLKYVLFDFDCAPGCFCIVDPQFLVIVNTTSGSVIDIRDPYLGPTEPCQSIRDSGGKSFHETLDGETKCKSEIVEITIGSSNYEFEIGGETNPTITVKKGDTVQVTFSSQGGRHDWTVAEVNGGTEKILARTCTVTPPAGTVSIQFKACQVGEHVYYCSLGNHRNNGMEGKFIVVEE